MQATTARSAYCQNSSACNHTTSSSRSGSAPPCTAAAASAANYRLRRALPRQAEQVLTRSTGTESARRRARTRWRAFRS